MEKAGVRLANLVGAGAPGRAGPHRGRGPQGYRRPDARILEDVQDRLADDLHLDASEISVKVEQGEVRLDGAVYRREDRRRAEDLVQSCAGVLQVQNNLRILPDPSNAAAREGASPPASRA